MARKKPYQKKPFESDCSNSDVSANIYQSMMLSEAWQDLTPRQQTLYLHMKLQYYAQKEHPNGEQSKFYFNQSKWRDKYKLYTDANKRAFYTDRDALILHGFIICCYCGQSQKNRSEYQFVDRWKQWEAGFKIYPNELTNSIQDRRPESQRDSPVQTGKLYKCVDKSTQGKGVKLSTACG